VFSRSKREKKKDNHFRSPIRGKAKASAADKENFFKGGRKEDEGPMEKKEKKDGFISMTLTPKKKTNGLKPLTACVRPQREKKNVHG